MSNTVSSSSSTTFNESIHFSDCQSQPYTLLPALYLSFFSTLILINRHFLWSASSSRLPHHVLYYTILYTVKLSSLASTEEWHFLEICQPLKLSDTRHEFLLWHDISKLYLVFSGKVVRNVFAYLLIYLFMLGQFLTWTA